MAIEFFRLKNVFFLFIVCRSHLQEQKQLFEEKLNTQQAESNKKIKQLEQEIASNNLNKVKKKLCFFLLIQCFVLKKRELKTAFGNNNKRSSKRFFFL